LDPGPGADLLTFSVDRVLWGTEETKAERKSTLIFLCIMNHYGCSATFYFQFKH
jgi:hypothetical protein